VAVLVTLTVVVVVVTLEDMKEYVALSVAPPLDWTPDAWTDVTHSPAPPP